MAVEGDFKWNEDNFRLWEAFGGTNNGYVITDFNFVDNFYLWQQILANGGGSGVDIKGDIDASTNPNYPLATKGDAYRVSVAGKVGGASGFPVSVGDVIIAWAASAAGTQAAVGANWNIKQVGLQRIFEVNLSTTDVTQTFGRDLAATIGRNVLMTVTGNEVYATLANYSRAVTGTWSVSGTNFAVLTNSKITAGIANGSMTIGLNAGFVAAVVSNTFIGVLVGAGTTTGDKNTGVGHQALQANTTGIENTAVGASALAANTTTSGHVAIGYLALTTKTATGGNCTAVGSNALRNTTTGSDLTAVGNGALVQNTTGGRSTAMGVDALVSNLTGIGITAIGYRAGFTSNASGGVFIGQQAGNYETGANKLFIDNDPRTNEADGRIKALVYGIFDALTANQFFTVNGHVLIREDLQFTTKAISVVTGDSVTINSPAGRFRKDASGAAFTLTNSYITANSIIVLSPANAAVDSTGINWTVLAGAGSAVITWAAAPTADFDMNFLVIN